MSDYLSSVALPSMKQRQKKLCQIRMKPRADPVYKDSSNFGVRMLEKLGWSEGKGLGKREDGMAAPILPKMKQDIEGFGYAGEKDNHWTQHDQDFNQLLKSLNGEEAPAEDSVDTAKIKSLEEKSKNSRARVHYKKFTRGKDLSRASEKDLANIFGKKSFEEVSSVLPVNNQVEPEQPSLVKQEESNVLGLTTINASMSLTDYFKSKMQSKSSNNMNGVLNSGDTPEDTSAAPVNGSIKKKKKKRRLSVENTDVSQGDRNGDVGQINEVESNLMKSDCKPQRNQLEKSDNVEEEHYENESLVDTSSRLIEDNLDESVSYPSTKKKKKKRRLSVNNSNVIEHTDLSVDVKQMSEKQSSVAVSEEINVKEIQESSTRKKLEENSNESIIINCTKKKKKKRRLSKDETNIIEQVDMSCEVEKTSNSDENCTAPTKKLKKKDKKEKSKFSEESGLVEQDVEPITVETKKSKKKKNKKCTNDTSVDTEDNNEKSLKDEQTDRVEDVPSNSFNYKDADNADDAKHHVDDDITCRVKVNVLKQLDEYAFPGSNFADIVGYGLTQDVKLIKRNSTRSQALEKHQFIRLKQTSVQRKRQMLKKVSAFKAI